MLHSNAVVVNILPSLFPRFLLKMFPIRKLSCLILSSLFHFLKKQSKVHTFLSFCLNDDCFVDNLWWSVV